MKLKHRHNDTDYFLGAFVATTVALLFTMVGWATVLGLVAMAIYFAVRWAWALNHEPEVRTARYDADKGVIVFGGGATPADVEYLRRAFNAMYARDHLIKEDGDER